MKRFLKKRWLGLPVGIITVVLLVCLLAGSALATNGYGFFTAEAEVEVVEAIAVGTFDSWDNLHPYGSDEAAVWYDSAVGEVNIDGDHDTAAGRGILGDVAITISDPEDPLPHIITIKYKKDEPGYVGKGFAPGEWIVIPLNLRNGSSGALDLGIYADGGDLILDCIYEENSGEPTAETFMPSGTWAPLSTWTATIAGKGGESGSAKVGALVLFVRITVPQDMEPNIYNTVTFTLLRGVTTGE